MESQRSDLEDQLDRLERLGKKWIEQIGRTEGTGSNVGNSTVYIQAGGLFALVLFFIASVTLGIALATSFEVSSRMTKIETKQDEQSQYLTAIYMMAPQLKPKGKKNEHESTK